MRIWIAALVSAPLIALSQPVFAQPVPETAGETREAAIQSGEDWGSASTPFDQAGGAGRFDEQDPWQGFNRKIFGFNEFVDRYALKPAAKGYRWVTPEWLDNTVTRFFSNLGDIGDGLNYIFQWRWGEAGNSLGRFGINTTLGVAGLFDVASDVELRNTDTSLDVTLGRWGVARGPYLVVPILGPSSVRDATTIYPSSYLWPVSYLEDDLARYSLAALYGVDLRADLLDLERNIVGDRYTFIRNAYLQRRLMQEGKDVEPALPDEDPELESDDGW